MWELFTANQNVPFSIALLITAGLISMEVISTLMGTAVSDLLDGVFPEIDIDLDVDADIDGADGVDSVPAVSQLLGWLNIGRVPVLILLVLFLLFFGAGGMITQSTVHSLTGTYLNSTLASVPALAMAFPAVHYVGGMLSNILPKDETEAIEELTLLGSEAEVVLGVAKKGSAAQVKVKDSYGKTHYLMFEPLGEEEIPAGSRVMLDEKHNSIFRGHSITPTK